MILLFKAILGLSLLCATLSGCAAVAGGATVNASGITANKPGQVLDVKVGDTFDVRIPTIPRPGFTWQPQNLDAQILQQLGAAVYQPDPSPNSAGGTVVLTFKVIGPGKAHLALLYASAPGGSAPSLYSSSFEITVNAK